MLEGFLGGILGALFMALFWMWLEGYMDDLAHKQRVQKALEDDALRWRDLQRCVKEGTLKVVAVHK